MKTLLHIVFSGWALSGFESVAQIVVPELRDDRLRLALYAEDPDIVTPIDCAVDAQGRLFVIESHTHSPRADYEGPKGDRIKVFSGQREDGRFASMEIFAEDIHQAQSLAFDPDGRLYVVCTREVLILHDRDQDGRSESRSRILHLDPYEKRGNPHGQMMGIAFSPDGWLYVATGTTSDDWISADGRRLEVGPYWGGIVARCKPDGSQLERIAWGFWNPFSLTFDRRGRLIAVDNDPDHRGPNRVLHIVPGGDYGYKRLYGRYGLHPYQAWEGEMPGTLPMIAGIGEAPTAILDASAAALPLDYRDSLIGASWGEHNLTLYRTGSQGASISAQPEILVQGLGHDDPSSPFRPAGMAASPVDGAIYITDWMLIDYTTHGRGRIWKLDVKPGIQTYAPRAPFAEPRPTSELKRMRKLAESSQSEDYEALRAALQDPDPFVRNAAVTALARPVFREAVIRDLESDTADVRLGALLALRRADAPDPESHIPPRLRDPDPEVVRMAMIWAGEKRLASLASEIDQAASRPGLTESFFQTWLATLQIFESMARSGSDSGSVGGDDYRTNRKLSPAFIEQLVHDETRPPRLRSIAMRWLEDVEKPINQRFLIEAALGSDSLLQFEAIQRLKESSDGEAQATLVKLAHDRRQPTRMRAEAIAALSANPDPSLVNLFSDPKPEIQLEAARALRLAVHQSSDIATALRTKLDSIRSDSKRRRLRSQLEFLLQPDSVTRPTSLGEWQTLLRDGGDPEAGRRVFFAAHSTCLTCHAVGGRGHRLGSGTSSGFVASPMGPDLSVVGRTADRDALIRSIIQPSASIAPEYQGWFVKMKDGSTAVGRNIDQGRDAIQLIMLDAREHDFPREDIESWGAMSESLMPAGLANSLAIEEFRDLVAYLESLR